MKLHDCDSSTTASSHMIAFQLSAWNREIVHVVGQFCGLLGDVARVDEMPLIFGSVQPAGRQARQLLFQDEARCWRTGQVVARLRRSSLPNPILYTWGCGCAVPVRHFLYYTVKWFFRVVYFLCFKSYVLNFVSKHSYLFISKQCQQPALSL